MKRIISFLFVLLIVISSIPFAYAAETDVDLFDEVSALTFDGKAWNSQAFLEGKEKDGIYIIAVDERGFRYDRQNEELELYIYVYNPNSRIIADSSRNKIQMAVAWNDDGSASSYDKFSLKLVDSTSDNVYLKYRLVDKTSVVDSSTVLARMKRMDLSEQQRLYQISGIEIARWDTNGMAKEYTYGQKTKIRGYDPYCGEDKESAVSSKKVWCTSFMVLELDVEQCYWRTQTSALGVNHRNQINAAYFAVPNDIWDQYVNLYSIKACWDEYRTSPMIATNDETLYEHLKSYIGYEVVPYDEEIEYRLFSDYYSESTNYTSYTHYNYGYNVSSYKGLMHTVDVKRPISMLTWFFPTDDKMELNQDFLSADEIVDYYKKYSHGKEDLFSSGNVGEGRTEGYNEVVITMDTSFKLANYASGGYGWFKRLMDYNVFNGGRNIFGKYTVDVNESYDDLQPIQVFKASYAGSNDPAAVAMANVLSYTPSKICEKYYFHEEEQAQDFKEYCAKAVAEDKTVVLFRYAETDYYSKALDVSPKIDGEAVVFEQNIFLDFDVIELQFEDEAKQLVTIPVSSDPSVGVGGGQAPQTKPGGGLGLGGLINSIWWKGLLGGSDVSLWALVAAVVLILVLVIVLLKQGKNKGNRRTYRYNSGGRQRYGRGRSRHNRRY